MPEQVYTFLMFEGNAEEAMRVYTGLWSGAEVVTVERWGRGEPGPEGSFKRAHFKLAGHDLLCFDSPVHHQFSFTPAISLFVECRDEAELDHAYERLSTGGQVLMALGSYGFSRKFGWVNDRFGVSWQLNLA
jgi:predicted 3-demethylubiquinone-9 3-methyltransferase (glyoxalase superfamily)